jgi:hypothetical protein
MPRNFVPPTDSKNNGIDKTSGSNTNRISNACQTISERAIVPAFKLTIPVGDSEIWGLNKVKIKVIA